MKRFILIALFALFALGFGKCDPKPLPGAPDADWQGLLPTGVFATTDGGVKVESSSAIDPAILPELDAGLNDLFEIAKAPPYNYGGKFTDDLHKWHVWLMPINHTKCIEDSFTIRVTSPLYPEGWDQDPVFDKDPAPGKVLLCVGGFMARDPHNEPGMVIVASVKIGRNISRFEGEHNVLYDADRPKFDASSNNHAHPLLPRADGSQLIVTQPDSRTAWVRLDQLFVLPPGYENYAGREVHIILKR